MPIPPSPAAEDPPPQLSISLDSTAQPIPTLPKAGKRTALPAGLGTAPRHCVGRFILKELMAQGGMGAIYRAADPAFGRDVVIKLVHERLAHAPRAARRFIEEARISGQLEHPGIPPVHEMGTLPDGRPFLAMKLIQGETLATFLTRVHDPKTGSRGPGSASGADRCQLLAIFEKICQAIGYAHSLGVIHRDLKPANIMVGAFGEVQVMDWGLAKRLGEAPASSAGAAQVHAATPLADENEPATAAGPNEASDGDETQPGAILGTPAFMPPEQAAGQVDQIDRQSDVFGLGAILCALLTGEGPYAGGSGSAVLYRASQGDLADAFARLDRCGADAPVIQLCKLCLAADKAQRPRDAGEVAAAVAQIRAQAEILARQAETERAAALARNEEQRKRRRAVQIAGSIITTVLIVGLLVSLWQMDRAIKAERLAVKEGQRRDEQRQRAEANERLALEQQAIAQTKEQQARQALELAEREKAVALAVRDFLENRLLRQANPWEQARLAGSANPTVRDLLAQAAVEFNPQTIADRFPQQPLVQAEVLETIGATYEGLGDFDQALVYFLTAHHIREEHQGPAHPDTLASLTNLAFTHLAASKQGEAMTLLLRLVTRLEELLRDAPTTEAAAILDSVLGLIDRRLNPRRFNLPTIKLGMNEAAMLLLQVGQALPRLQRLEDHCTRLFGPEDRRTLLMKLLFGFGCHALGQVQRACEIYETVLQFAEKQLEPDDYVQQGLREVLAVSYGALGTKPDEQVRLLTQSLETSRRVLGLDHPRTLATMGNLAVVHREAGRHAEAIVLLEQVRDSRERRLGDRHPSALIAMSDLADLYLKVRRFDDAIALLEFIHDADVRRFGPESPDALSSKVLWALGLKEAGRVADAIRLLEETRAVAERVLRPDHLDHLVTLYHLATAYHAADRLEDAEVLQTDAHRQLRARLGTRHPQTLASMASLVRIRAAARRLDEAAALMTECLTLQAGRRSPLQRELLHALSDLAAAYQRADRWAEAVTWYERLRTALVQARGATHMDTLVAMTRLANAYQKVGRHDDAVPLSEEVLRVLKARLGPEHVDTLQAVHNLGLAYRGLGRLEESATLLEEALAKRTLLVGPDHATTLQSQSELAHTYRQLGRLADALTHLEQVRKRREHVLGPHHLDTLAAMNDQAWLLIAVGQVPAGTTLHEETLSRRRTHLGPTHPHTLLSMNNLGRAYVAGNRLAEAVTQFEECLKLRQEKMGADHPDTLLTLSDLAQALKATGQWDSAKARFEQLLELQAKRLGATHPEVMPILLHLATVHHELNEGDRALVRVEELLQHLRDGHFQHPQVASLLREAVLLLNALGERTAAEHWQRLWLTTVRMKSGTDDVVYAEALATLGYLLMQQAKWSEAETVLRDSLAIRERRQPEEWSTFHGMSLLGGALLGQGSASEEAAERSRHLAAAEPLLLKGFAGMKESWRAETGRFGSLSSSPTPPSAPTAARTAVPRVRMLEAVDRLIQLNTLPDGSDRAARGQGERRPLAR